MWGMDDFAPWLGVFETLRVVNGIPLFTDEHRREIQRAAAALGLNCDLAFLDAAQEISKHSGRLRWVITPKRSFQIFNQETLPAQASIALKISSVRVGSQNWDARFKTISYLAHAQAIATSDTPEVVLLNEKDEVASAARANIFWRTSDRLYTPAHEAGCRRGVVREFVMKQIHVADGFYGVNELLTADEIFITNSLRGIVSISSIEGCALKDFATADTLRRAYDKACQAFITPPESDFR